MVDVDEELEKQRQERVYQEGQILPYDRVYKPSQTIEFNWIGEVVLYSAAPNRDKSFWLQYPYVLFDQLSLTAFFAFWFNPFELSYYNKVYQLLLVPVLLSSRMKQLAERSYYVSKLSLLRGGKILKIERDTLMGDNFTDWAEIKDVQIITEDFQEFDDRDTANFLTQEGQLKYELAVEFENYKVKAINHNNLNLYFSAKGTVHQPELFEATLKGFHIDTSDFQINTANNSAYREGHYNN